MSPAAAMMIPSTRPEDPIAILFLSDSGRDGSVRYTGVLNDAAHKHFT